MNKQIYNIPTKTDTLLTLQIAEVKGEGEPYKELALMLETETGTEADGYQVTTLNKRGIDELIAKLTELKEQITY